jgi:hypothetical protein
MNALLSLHDLVSDIELARRTGDLPRLILLCYCELRPWARWAHERQLAAHASALFSDCPHTDRESFLASVDNLLLEARQVRSRLQQTAVQQ